MTARLAILALTPGGLATARRIKAVLPKAEILGRAGRVAGADATFDDAGAALRQLFAASRPIVGVCAAGILVRALAPLLADKRAEPAVVAVAEDASAVVPLLGGHRGANELARRIAGALGAVAAITTAGELALGIALDEPPAGWTLANPDDAKDIAQRLIAGEPARVEGDLPWLEPARFVRAEDARIVLAASEHAIVPGPGRLVYHPRTLVLGVGAERGVSADELARLVAETLASAGLAPGSVALLASLDLKEDETALHALADSLGRPARFFNAATLEALTPRLANPSEAVFAAVGCHGVAEAAALAGAGPEGSLVVAKRKSARATCAIARAPRPIDPERVGRPRGALAVVGLGPGGAGWLSPEAAGLIARADDLVGYRRYLDLAAPLRPGQVAHPFALGEEEARAARALDLASEGRRVVLVCSGDPGIYAMAAPVFELIEGGTGPAAWSRIAVTVAPGISALQAAAARAGAPLGHDFCAISLSDLLTPAAVIEGRLEAAAAADFAVALYNPASRRRRAPLNRALEILGRNRPPDTPVVIAANLGRAGERVEITTLAGLDPRTVDMLTVLLIGASTTRAGRRPDGSAYVYTPRGYRLGGGAKAEAAE